MRKFIRSVYEKLTRIFSSRKVGHDEIYQIVCTLSSQIDAQQRCIYDLDAKITFFQKTCDRMETLLDTDFDKITTAINKDWNDHNEIIDSISNKFTTRAHSYNLLSEIRQRTGFLEQIVSTLIDKPLPEINVVPQPTLPVNNDIPNFSNMSVRQRRIHELKKQKGLIHSNGSSN